MPYEIRENNGQHCLYKKDSGKIVMGSCHTDRAETEKMMRAMMANEMMRSTMYLIDEYVATRPGEPYRLFPFGKIVKNGHTREITPELAARFKLPHFQPAIKLGSHEETTPAGGHIKALEVRADGYEDCQLCRIGQCKVHGLWVVPDWNDKGGQALADGAYRYHSPEVLWEDGALEDPATGAAINGPLILGDALLHMPHLGEATALYSIEPIHTEEITMENVTVPASLWDKFIAPLFAKEPEVKEVVKTVEPEDYAATKQERDQLKAQIESQKLDAERKSRIEKFDAALKETKADPTMAELLADLPEEKAEAIMRQFKALSAQIDNPGLEQEHGQEGQAVEGDPKAQFNALVLKAMDEKKITNYNAAFEVVKLENPDLFKQWARN